MPAPYHLPFEGEDSCNASPVDWTVHRLVLRNVASFRSSALRMYRFFHKPILAPSRTSPIALLCLPRWCCNEMPKIVDFHVPCSKGGDDSSIGLPRSFQTLPYEVATNCCNYVPIQASSSFHECPSTCPPFDATSEPLGRVADPATLHFDEDAYLERRPSSFAICI